MKTSTPCPTSACACNPGLARRDFLKLAGLVAAGVALPNVPAVAGPFAAEDFAYSLIPADKKLSAAWLRSLAERGEPTTYRGTELATIGMPVGGICTGQIYLGGDGRLWHWDIFNAPDPGLVGLTDGPHYDRPLKTTSPLDQGFALQISGAGGTHLRRLDQTGFREVSFCGQYPIGTVNYRDATCPVEVKLEAYSPFIPLNAEDSGLPTTVMEFTVKNSSSSAVEVELAGWLENAICKFSAGAVGTRRNRVVRDAGVLRIDASAEGGTPINTVKRTDIVFADFEDGTYGGWKVEGTAFGTRPVKLAEVPAYQSPQTMGAHGQALVNSHASAPGNDPATRDHPTGKLTSPEFTIERNFIRFLIGGGADAAKLGLRLIVDENVVRSAAGHNDNRMQPGFFDVREFAGRTARLTIVDEATGGWGHIGVDNIVFSDVGATPISATDAPDFGTLTLALLAAEAGDRACAGVGDASPTAVFEALSRDGAALAEKTIPEKLIGALSRRWSLKSGEERKAVFVIAWHFPKLEYTAPALTGAWRDLRDFTKLKRYYAKRFQDASTVALYLGKNFARLSAETKLWRDTWSDSTLPHWFLERTLLNISTLATATCHRFDSGRYWFWEGIYCCQGTCTHVWQYAQAIARIFPEIERDLRERVDYGIGFEPATGMIGLRAEFQFTPATDGQAGTILRTLREHQMSRDDVFLKRNWPNIKKAVEWLVAQDENGDGVISRAQPNTMDAEWFGEISWISSLYVAALKAGAELAKEIGDDTTTARWAAIATKGSAHISEQLFHKDQYFIQRPDPAHLEHLGSGYGCEIDQMFGQSWAWQVGLGRVLPEDKARKALASLWKYNFTPDVGPFRSGSKIPGGRWYAMPGEGGLVMCSFPDPEHPRPVGNNDFAIYFNECWTGAEYQAASHMIWEGGDLLEKGLAITRMVHDRHHASRRNPWNEVECGDHYGRALASYGVFTAACGFEYHGPRQRLAFNPRLTPENFKCAFTSAEGWGSFRQHLEGSTFRAELDLKWGKLALKTLGLTPPGGLRPQKISATLAGKSVAATLATSHARVELSFAPAVLIPAAQKLEVTLT